MINMSESVIELRNVDKFYGDRKALDQINFSVKKGEIHAFLGPNGAGKSTTIKLISGMLQPDRGEIEVFGEKLARANLQKLGILPEAAPLYEEVTCRDYLIFVARIHGLSLKEARSQLDYLTQLFGLKNYLDRLIKNLSKGYKQRVALAQTLMHKPHLIILDEPTVGLDPQSVVEIRDLLKDLSLDHTIFLSSHLLKEVEASASHVTLINHGKILLSGKMSEVLDFGPKRFQIKVKGWAQEAQDQILKAFSLRIDKTVMRDESLEIIFSQTGNAVEPFELNKFLVNHNVLIEEFKELKYELEDIFLKRMEQ
jgi:ABC-2 type transport system ATP-binding protein